MRCGVRASKWTIREARAFLPLRGDMPLYQQGQSQTVELADFAPDLDPTMPSQGQGILLDMDQAIPTLKGFQALNAAAPYVAGALPETPTGSTIGYYSTGATQFWAGGANHLYRPFGSIWVQADSMGTTPFGAGRWRFAQF